MIYKLIALQHDFSLSCVL